MASQLDIVTYDPHRVIPTLYIRGSDIPSRELALDLAKEGIKYNLYTLTDEGAEEAETEECGWHLPELSAGEGHFPGIENINWWKKAFGRKYAKLS